MKKFCAVLMVAALAVLALSATASAERFRPDSSFGNGGRINLQQQLPAGTELGGVKPGNGRSAYVLFNQREFGPCGYGCATQPYLRRIDSSGRMDAAFGSVKLPPSTGEPATLWTDSEGRPLLVSYSSPKIPGPDTGTSTITVMRFDDRGALDTGFGGGGISTTTVPCQVGQYVRALGTGGGGLVLAFGCASQEKSFQSALLRIGANGRPVGEYGSGGFSTFPHPGFSDLSQSMVLRPNGAAISVVHSFALSGLATSTTLQRYSSHGLVDQAFGKRSAAALGGVTVEGALSEQAIVWRGNGKSVGLFSGQEVMLGGFNSNGSIDPRFGTRGFATRGQGFVVLSTDPNGRLLLFGAKRRKDGEKLIVLRLTANGHRDKSFAHGGAVAIGIAKAADLPRVELVGRAGNQPLILVSSDSCGRESCTHTAELIRLRLVRAGG